MSELSQLDFRQSGTKLGEIANKTGLESKLDVATGGIIAMVLILVGTIFFLLTVYAGIRWMTAQGNSEHVETAKKTLIAAVIGLIITMMAYAITAFVTGRLGSI